MAFNKEQFLDDLATINLLELADLIDAIKEKFNVTAAVVSAGPSRSNPGSILPRGPQRGCPRPCATHESTGNSG